jgi:enamine deaminase RidA (YjgF/YER057c/UK114 family)
MTDLTHLATMRRVRDEYIDTAQPPASTLLQVVALALPELMFEVDAVAAAAE